MPAMCTRTRLQPNAFMACIWRCISFNDDRQQLVLLDRFLTLITEVRLADFLDGTVRAATLAPDNRIWLLDESSLVLREFDPTTSAIKAPVCRPEHGRLSGR